MKNNIGEARRNYEYYVINDKFTQDDAAEFFGVAPSTYKKWEQGQGKLNGEILCAIADKYDTTVDYLLKLTDNPRPRKSADSIYRALMTSAELTELKDIYSSLSDEGRKQLLIFARGLAATYPRG